VFLTFIFYLLFKIIDSSPTPSASWQRIREEPTKSTINNLVFERTFYFYSIAYLSLFVNV